MQFRRYQSGQVFAFDFGSSIRVASLAMGGDWQNLGSSLYDGAAASVFLQPLARIDDPAERNWASEWLAAILAAEGVTVDPQVKEYLWSRSEEHTSELQSLMRISYAVFCLKK